MLQLAAAMDFQTRLLIVDDDPGIRELTAGFLQTHGYLVDTAADGAAMRAALARERYALVVLDVDFKLNQVGLALIDFDSKERE